jgi:hypothetical protein
MRLVVDPSYPHCEVTVEGFVRRVFFFTLAFFLLASSLTAQQNSAAKQGPLVVTHVAVIDVARGQAQPDRTVVILVIPRFAGVRESQHCRQLFLNPVAEEYRVV